MDVKREILIERDRKQKVLFKQKLIYIFKEINEFCNNLEFITCKLNSSNTSICVDCKSTHIFSAYNQKDEYLFNGYYYPMNLFNDEYTITAIKDNILEHQKNKQAEIICEVFKVNDRVCIDGDVGNLQVVNPLGVMLKLDNKVLKKYDPKEIKEIRLVE